MMNEKVEADITEYYQLPLSSLTQLPDNYKKLLKRIAYLNEGNQLDVETVSDILELDIEQFSCCKGVGKFYIDTLIAFKNKLPLFLNNFSFENEIKKEIPNIEFNEIDNILIEDIESYLLTLDEKKMDIALSRWGFNHPHETLEEVGTRYRLTRERIRQFEKPINANFVLNLRIPPKALWGNIREKMTEDLAILLPNLAKCFDCGKLFYEFIALCCQVEIGSIRKIVFTKINIKIINQLFCTNQSPLDQEIVINELTSNYGYNKAAAINGIKQLEKSEHILITEQGIYPKNLSKIEAIAHVLAFHPSGLPWKDITKVANKKNYSKSPFDENRTTSAFHDSEFVYLCGLGTFRNLMFLNVEQFNIPKIMQHLIDYFKKNNLTVLHLHDYYYQTKNQHNEIEYFTLRHLVREYGEEYGLYFNGKSGSDRVSLDSEIKNLG